MSSYVIKVQSLGKQYRIGEYQGKYKSLRESLSNTALAPFRSFKNFGQKKGRNTIWALRNVDFEVASGEVVGIIGRNGAGKSTLLKLLSRITEPTTGEVRIRGRVGSLLEVGTGFHPELTGRENIFLNGAILGMSRAEVGQKFDEIVDFAEIEKFIDTPAKHYSSGMYMRLAFAVAAHLEPEILLIDEVLAVGDTQFQKKCLGKMGQVAQEGRTVLFVSHNMAAVQNLCGKGIILNHGEKVYEGNINEAISTYTKSVSHMILGHSINDRKDRQGNQDLTFNNIQILDSQNQEISTILSGQDTKFRFHYTCKERYQNPNLLVAFNIFNSQGVVLANLNSKEVGRQNLAIQPRGYFECTWPRFNLRSGTYTCNLFCQINGTIVDWVQSAFQITVEDGDFFQTGNILDRSVGEIFVPHDWDSKTD